MRALNYLLPVLLCLFCVPWQSLGDEKPGNNRPLKALLIAGGCCHDYAAQHVSLYKGIQARANVQVDVMWTNDRSTEPPLPVYDQPDWAEGYDVIIHDECAAGNKDLGVMKRILDAHKTIPAVHLHCAMHSFRNGTDQWFKHLGLQSSGHGPQEPIEIAFQDDEHPITKPLKDWTTGKEELYNNVNLFDAHPLALGTQTFERKDKKVVNTAVVAWTNEKQGARSFSTTIGHNTFTVEDPRYLDLVTRGLLWSCGKLDAAHLTPFTGENQVTEMVAPPLDAAKELGKVPDNATLVTVTASSEEAGKQNFTWRAVDGNKDTRWCAAGGGMPQWLQISFEKPRDIDGVSIVWESQNNTYRHKIEGSIDGKTWIMLDDATASTQPGDTSAKFAVAKVRDVKITCTGTSQGGWASIREVALNGPGLGALYPKLAAGQQSDFEAATKFAAYAKGGNIPPMIVKLSAADEAAILQDVTVPDGFDVTVFSSWQAANYPVYVAAAPNGDLYVSSDGNGSLGRNPDRGRVLRLRDKDGDGRADEVTEFIKHIDSPRGLVWDHDRLYVLHPPDLSVHFDRDGDGIAEEAQTLIEGIAFGFDQRPPDHTTNGLELGIDGWIYIAGGDFGFMDAVGTDGRRLRHRGGGVIRFRPDGSGLELFATGTRNILGTPMSPLLDIFARDNTNDGGGWDVRFHHFSGLEDHGYPRLYKNFADECVAPLADYGGGSGCGSVYIHEPGFPDEWANAPFTCDWGTGALWRHSVQRTGGSFAETTAPQKFIKLTRPTDADVDGMSGVYLASWKGPATFDWAGPNQGYIVRVSPEGYSPEPLPDFEKLADRDLVGLLESPSHVRTLAAQRTLLRRASNADTAKALVALAGNAGKPLQARVAALYALSQRGVAGGNSAGVIQTIQPLANDPALQPFVLRAVGDMALDRLTAGEAGPAPAGILIAGTQSATPRTRIEATVAAARQKRMDAAPAVAALFGDPDPVVAHTAFRALAKLGAAEAAFAVLDSSGSSEAQRRGASLALMRMHDQKVVDGVITRLAKESRLEIRRHLLAILSRLHYQEAEWKGDNWGTRPDTRGPYYQLATWSESGKVLAALRKILAQASPEEAAFLVKELNRNRIELNDALDRLVALAATDAKLLPEAVAQMVAASEVPAGGVALVYRAAALPDAAPATLAQAVAILARRDDGPALPVILKALTNLQARKGAGKELDAARKAFLQAPKLENRHLELEEAFHKNPLTPEGEWAAGAMLELATRKSGSPESRQRTQEAIASMWALRDQRVGLMRAAASNRSHFLDDRIRVALGDQDQEVAAAARYAAGRLQIRATGEDQTPKIGSLGPERALSAVIKERGDAALGEAVFVRATCTACHTVSQAEAPKGPYLGSIAATYQRPELAAAILDPNKTIAQGFATNIITLKNGSAHAGFVTDEAGDHVTIRDITAKEHTLEKSEITKRDTLPTSMMPPALMNNFTVHEMASLLDYLEALAKKK